MEATVVCWDCIGIMAKKMEATMGLGLRVEG